MIKYISLFLAISVCCIAMDNPASLHNFMVPGDKGSPCLNITAEKLRAIKSEQELSTCGILQAIAIRPKTNERTLLPSCQITKAGLQGDKAPIAQYPHPYLAAVSLMRADVSNVLGGAHVPGDNLHVEGMSLAIDTLKVGDLIIVSEPHNKQMAKVVFLMTHYPHTACSRLEARVGAEAFNFINGMGAYEKTSLTSLSNSQLLNGPQQRVRGVLLAVLQEGIPSVGDQVFIESGQQRDQRIAKMGLLEFCAKALADSKEAEEKFSKKEDIIRNARRNVYEREKAANAK